MPTLSSVNVPTPKSWDEFEAILLDVARIRWRNPEFYRNGRQGQRQDGVDIWGQDTEGRHVGIQCKNTVDGVSKAQIAAEITKAEMFSPDLELLEIATSAKRDSSIQEVVRKISSERMTSGKFKVGILFWDDICHDLGQSDEIFFKHYPQFRTISQGCIDLDKTLYDELIVLLEPRGVIRWIDENNLAGFSFENSKLDPLKEFYFEWGRPDKEFLDPELETLRKELHALIERFLEDIGTYTFPTKLNPDRNSIDPDLEITNPKLFCKIVNNLHHYAGEIVRVHTELYRKGRKIFYPAGK